MCCVPIDLAVVTLEFITLKRCVTRGASNTFISI